jgi:hypothetical protein
MFSLRSQVPVLFLLAVGLCGCSGAPAAVKGKVTADGKGVTAGTIVLSPLAAEGNAFPGKPGLADIRPDGTYSVNIEPGESGLAKRFAVRFTPPPLQLTAATAKDAVIPYAGLVPKQAEVEIKAGANEINIELIPAR